MLFDLEKNKVPSRKEFDLAIIGAGAAGISIAKEFSQSGYSIVLIESGTFEFEKDTQDLYKGEATGNIPGSDAYMDSSRLRYFGGTTNHWSGWCRPLDSIDFKKRDWVSNSGWPVSKENLEDYYRRAEDIIGIKSPFNDLDNEQFSWSSADKDLLGIRAPYFQFQATRFGSKYRDDILEMQNLDVIIHANVTDIRLNEAKNRVSELDVKALNGFECKLKAKYVILACGGIENPRILLNCNKDIEGGIGNQNGLVGKYFMEHPHFRSSGWLLTRESNFFKEYDLWEQFRKRKGPNGETRARVFSITEDVQEQEKLLNASFYIIRLNELLNSTMDEAGVPMANALDKLSDHLLMPKGVNKKTKLSSIFLRAEQTPRESNQVTLTTEKDAFGLLKSKLVSNVSKQEIENYKKSFHVLARGLGLDKIGRIRVDLHPESDVQGGMHHMGTTRMSTSANEGVVNSNCKVHDVDNLFIAGSSVFSTAGFANPTFTLIAMAIRMSDHIKSLLEND